MPTPIRLLSSCVEPEPFVGGRGIEARSENLAAVLRGCGFETPNPVHNSPFLCLQRGRRTAPLPTLENNFQCLVCVWCLTGTAHTYMSRTPSLVLPKPLFAKTHQAYFLKHARKIRVCKQQFGEYGPGVHSFTVSLSLFLLLLLLYHLPTIL